MASWSQHPSTETLMENRSGLIPGSYHPPHRVIRPPAPATGSERISTAPLVPYARGDNGNLIRRGPHPAGRPAQGPAIRSGGPGQVAGADAARAQRVDLL